MSQTFDQLGLSEKTLKELKKKGYEEPTEIQALTIPAIINETNDIIGQAQTGTGKTAAFGLPLMELIQPGGKKVKALILAPTRELAVQVSEELNSFNSGRKLKIAPIYGGQSYTDQFRRLKEGLDIIVGTPGRINDHIERGTIDLSQISFMVLDEADEMLNMGFINEVETILTASNPERRTLLFSATLSEKIREIASLYLKDELLLKVKTKQLTADLTEQIYFEVNRSDRFEALCRIIDIEMDFYGLIFCRTKVEVDELTSRLVDRGYGADGIHGDLSQRQRERVLDAFKKKRNTILAATDVAARGIDINDLTHVINYSLPQDPESYVHRIGRTGRAKQKGIAVTFISPSEYRKLMFITRTTKSSISKKRVPDASEIIKTKQKRLKSELLSIIQSEGHDEYMKTADSLLKDSNPEEIVAALIKHTMENDLDLNRYREITEVSVDNRGKARLFISMGKKDGLTPGKLTKMVQDISSIEERKIKEVTLKDAYSFITVPFEDAEKVIASFRENNVSIEMAAKKSHGDSSKKPNRKRKYKR